MSLAACQSAAKDYRLCMGLALVWQSRHTELMLVEIVSSQVSVMSAEHDLSIVHLTDGPQAHQHICGFAGNNNNNEGRRLLQSGETTSQ